jgi:CheY-like chemotaxis protein
MTFWRCRFYSLMPEILLVEDKDILRHALRMALENAGSGVTGCVDARSAVGET